MDALRRIGLCFGSLLVSIVIFSFFYSLLTGPREYFQAETFFLVFRITMIFAAPAWCLYLPFVIALRDAEERRIWTIVVSGILIGPASLLAWGLLLQLRGDDPDTIWGDPLAPGLGACLTFAFFVGSLTTCFYVVGLKLLTRAPHFHRS